jgi:hypothetical protein
MYSPLSAYFDDVIPQQPALGNDGKQRQPALGDFTSPIGLSVSFGNSWGKYDVPVKYTCLISEGFASLPVRLARYTKHFLYTLPLSPYQLTSLTFGAIYPENPRYQSASYSIRQLTLSIIILSVCLVALLFHNDSL